MRKKISLNPLVAFDAASAPTDATKDAAASASTPAKEESKAAKAAPKYSDWY